MHRSAHTAPSVDLSSPLGLIPTAADSTKDLVLTVTLTFKTNLRCQQTANRAWRILIRLPRGFAVLTPELFRPLYLALSRPVLEYGQPASSHYLQRDIVLIERKQRLVTRLFKGMRELPYEDRLPRLNIVSLERRRLRGDLILAYNTFHGRLHLPQAEFFRCQRSETFEDMTSSCATAVFAYSYILSFC